MLFFELVYNGIKDAVDKLAAARRRIAVGYFDILVERYRNRNLREIDYFLWISSLRSDDPGDNEN